MPIIRDDVARSDVIFARIEKSLLIRTLPSKDTPNVKVDSFKNDSVSDEPDWNHLPFTPEESGNRSVTSNDSVFTSAASRNVVRWKSPLLSRDSQSD